MKYVLRILLLFLFIPAVYAQDDPDPTRFASEIEAFRKWDATNKVPEDFILFTGSSSIRMWPVSTSFPDEAVLNRGFGGSHLSDVIHYLDDVVLKYRPRMIVLYAGDNDIAGGKPAERVLQDFRAVVDRVHGVMPGVPIVYVSIKPSLSRWAQWPEMDRANRLVREYTSSRKSLRYADLASPMLVDGRPDSTLFLQDGLHLNEKGYALWTRTIRPVLREGK